MPRFMGYTTLLGVFSRRSGPVLQALPDHNGLERWHNLCSCLGRSVSVILETRGNTATDGDTVVHRTSLWTAARGTQVISCELIVPRYGPAIIRCGYGPESIIRSQCIASPETAAVVAETWKLALLTQGFRLGPSSVQGN